MRLTVIASFVLIALMSTAAFSSTVSAGALNDFLFGGQSLLKTLAAPISAFKASEPSPTTTVADENPAASSVARSNHTATDLGGGKVLIVGGDAAGTTEIFDLNSRTSSLATSLHVPRTGHTATLLSDGRVLITGGSSGGKALASTEIYDNGAFVAGPNLTAARAGQTATALPDGRILIVGGDAKGTAEIMDAAAQSSQKIKARLGASRSFHSARLLKSGNVLIVGGSAKNGGVQTGEIFDAETMTFSAANGSLHSARVRPLLRELPDGKVQIIGGNDEGSMEMFTPDGNYFSAFAHVIPNRNAKASAAFQMNGAKTAALNTDAKESGATEAESQVMATATRAALINNGEASNSLLDRTDYSLTEISGSNKILVTGGKNSQGETLNTAMLLSESNATVTTDKLDYPPGEVVTISGTGFEPGETVKLTIVRDRAPTGDGNTETITFSAVANAEGNFVNTDYTTAEEDIGASFVLTATGQTSGRTAQTAFTDDVTVKVVSSPAGTTFTLIKTVYTSANCNTGGGTPATVPNVDSTTGNTTGGMANSTSVKLQAAINSNQSGAFVNWTSSSLFTPIDAYTICVNGAAANQTRTYTANYATSVTTALTVAAAAGTYGGTANLTATLKTPNSSGTGVSGKSVTFTVNSSNFTATTDANGVATVSVSLAAINAGSYTINANFAGDSSFQTSNGSNQLTVNKANATCSVTGYTGTYDAAAHGASGSCTGIGGVTLAGLNLGATFTNVPGGTASWTFTDATGNYNNQSGSAAINISKAVADCSSIIGFSGSYNAAAHSASGACTGVDAGGAATGGTLNLGGSFTNVPGGTANWTFTGGTNYTDQSGSVSITITKANANCSVTGYSVIFDAAAHTATGACTGVQNENLSGLDLSGTTHTNAGNYTDSWTFTDVTGNYNNTGGTVADSIAKADASCSISGYTGTYDAAAHSAIGACTGVGGVSDVLGGLNLGNSFTDTPGGTAHWVFSGGTNYNDQSGDVSITINKAAAVCAVNGYTGVYDAMAHGATGSCTGVGSVNLSGSLNLGGSFTDVPGGTAHWTFSGGINYTDQSGDAAIVINKADANVSVNGYTGVYDGAAHGASGTATGIGGVDLSAGLNLGASFTDVPGGTANWSFNGGTNYNNQSGTAAIVINKASATINIVPYSGVYDGSAHGLSGSATGVGGADLSANLNFGATFANVPGGTATWTFTGGTNYNDATGTAAIAITKANAAITVTPYNVTYDGNPHTATGSATGVLGESLSGLDLSGTTHTNADVYTADAWTFTDTTGNYSNAAGTVDDNIGKANAVITVTPYSVTFDGNPHTAIGAATGIESPSPADLSGLLNLSGTTHTNAGTYTGDAWSFAGNGNYNPANGTVDNSITKADANCSINGYTGTYDAAAHGASGACTGAGGANLSGLNLGDSFTNVPGGTAHWTFTDSTGNYNNQSGDASIVINKANAIINVLGYTGIYDGAGHGASGSATGISSVDLSAGLNLGATFTNVPGGTATWTFTGGTNYNNASGSVAITINKANASCSVSGYTGIYDAAAHGATGSCTGVGGVNLTGSLNLGATFINVPGGTANWTFTGGTNYNNQSGSVPITISSRDALVRYIGQTNFVTSGTSATTAQVTLSASVQDPTGLALSGAKMDFIDATSNKVLASGVTVSPVANSTANTGTANTIVTLSTGQYGAESYVIMVRMSGNYDNIDQAMTDKTATVVVSKPAATNEAIGGGRISGLASAAGTYSSSVGAQISWTVGMTFNRSGTNQQGKITATIPQPDGSVFYVKSNSISSMAITNVSNGKKGTIYTKSSITKILADGTPITIQGNVSLRMDITDYTSPTTADEVGFTVLSSSNSELFYSNNWKLDSATNAWRTVPQAIGTGTVKIN